MEDRPQKDALIPELYFLISKFLADGPLQETAKVLVRELEQKEVLPRRIDWLGNEHGQTYEELERKYEHIDSNHLLEICRRIGPIIDKELPPSVPGIISLLGSGRQSLLRTKDTVYKPRSLLDYCTRLHGVSLPDSSVTKPIHNFQRVIFGREYGGPVRRKLLVPTSLYSKVKLLRRTVGHLSSVYCVLFDRTGRYIITGADDLLIKIWSASDGRLLATLRGASAEITDIAINLDNTMLAAGSLDRILRVWDMQTTSPIAVLSAHTGMITSVNFCPSPRSDLKYLVTTSTDGSIAFWQYATPRGQKITFAPKPTQFHEKLRPGQAQMMCTTFSPGGMFLAAGSADHHVRVYLMGEDGPKRILETEAYTDAVDSVQWSHRGLRFISGSKDGTAHIWTFETQQWKSVKLSMTERLSTCPEPEEGKKLKVTMIAWDASDNYVITAVNDFTIKIWNSKTAKLHRVLRGHKDELYVLESNPKDEHVLLSAGHDGQIFLWDIEQGVSVANFLNDIDGQGHGSVFDAKWSPDGTMIAATDSHGHILIFGLGIGPEKYKVLPTELFFHTDFRPLLRDGQHHVVDEQTQIMPHLMPPPFLVDADGNPHPSKFQRFVPGRENCCGDQLIPNLSVGADGVVVEDHANVQQNAVSPSYGGNNYSHIDRMIAALANRQGNSNEPQNNANANHSQLDRMIEALANRQGQDQAPDSNNRGARNSLGGGNILGGSIRSADVQFGRRLTGEPNNSPRQGTSWGRPPEQQIQEQPLISIPTLMKFVRRIYVRPMKYLQLQNLKQVTYNAGQFETQEYKREMRRRPIMINTASAASTLSAGAGRPRNPRTNGAARVGRRRGGQNGQQSQPAYRTRAVRDQEELEAPPPPQVHEEEEEDEDSSNSSGDSSYSNVEEQLEGSSDESDTESSDYSDWVADTPGPNLEPPKRSKRKPLSRRRTFSDDSSDEEPATEQQSGSGAVPIAKRGKRNKRVAIPPPMPNGEIPELFRPAEWLSEVIPRKAPYYPQMGDEVVYFRQGHQSYLDAVRLKKVYKLTNSAEPWKTHTLRDHELVRVIGIKYEIRPPRLCCLKLAIIDEDGNMTGTSFKIKYHDMPDVLDFLVLRQTFDLAVQRNWCIGDRFRCMIGDGWWMGQIESRHALSSDFPDSFFMCFRVRWDNGEYEYMSPWDMEPIDEDRLPDEVGGAISVLPEEIRATLYQPKSEEWHRGDRDGSCRRIIAGLEQVMRFSIAEHFLAPVDLNLYPDYAYLIEYPIDLTTVKSRFENHFYRRITCAQFDVRYLATNAEKYNRRHTNIVKHARIITDLCLRIIREPNDIDVAAVYHQLVDVYHSSESENDNESDVGPSTSTGPSTSAAAAAARQQRRMSSARRSNRIRSDGDWRSDCRQLLDLMWQRPDSLPFREPVDTIEYPDYLEIIATPMDLRTVKEDLLGGNYQDPLDFAKDVRLIFQNSKNYNTNKRSRIYSMTLRLSALFESHIKTVTKNWNASVRRANKNKSNSGSGRGSSSPVKRTPPERNRGGGAGPSTRRKPKAVAIRRIPSSEEEEDDDDEGNENRPSGSQRIRRRNGAVGVIASTSGSNRVTSSSSAPAHRRSNGGNATTEGSHHEESSNKSSSSSSDSDEEEDDSSEQATSDGSSAEEEADVEEHSNDTSPEQPKRRGRRQKKGESDEESQDSEESYNPNERRRKNVGNGAKRQKFNNKRKQKSAKRKRGRECDDDDEEDDEANDNSNRNRRSAQKDRSSRNQRKVRRVAGTSDDELPTAMATASQQDESTQDTISNTPRKKGRPPKAKPANTNGANSNTAITPAKEHHESPSRNTRHQLATSGVGGSGNHIGRRPQNAAENDHSYHLPVRNGRLIESDTDSLGVSGRPTRQSVKRAILEWARGSDIEEDPDESDDAEEILPTPTKDDLPSTSRAALASAAGGSGTVRQLRTNRNTVVEATNDDSDDDSDNEPLANNQQKTASPAKTSSPHPLTLRRRLPSPIRPTHMTRSHATSTTSNVATSSSRRIAALTENSTHDHNYLGSVATTSGAAARLPRRVLSRHQRNADELDISLDPLESSRLLSAVTNHRRPTSTTTSVAAAASSESLRPRRGRPSSSQERSSQPEEDENEEDEDEDDAAASDQGTDGGSSTQQSNAEEDEKEDTTDSEDNQPLTSYVAPAAANGSQTRGRPTKLIAKKRPGRPRRPSNSDNSFAGDDDDEDYEVQRASRQRRRQKDSHSNNRSMRNQRGGTRSQKRPLYNEQSEDDEYENKRRRHMDGYPSTSNSALVRRRINDNTETAEADNNNNDDDEDDDDNSADSGDEHLVSVSSRGRVRKISAKARGIFKE